MPLIDFSSLMSAPVIQTDGVDVVPAEVIARIPVKTLLHFEDQKAEDRAHEAAENRVSQAQFKCVACGHAEHADIHAAKNILAAGHAVWLLQKEAFACGGVVRRKSARKRATGAAPMKQEPSEAIAHG